MILDMEILRDFKKNIYFLIYFKKLLKNKILVYNIII